MPLDKSMRRILARSQEAYERGDYIIARQLLTKIFYKISRHDPDYSKLVTMKATVEYKLGNKEAAIEFIESVPLSKANDAIHWASRAEIYRGAKRISDAEKAISIALRHDTNSCEVWLAAAAIYHDARHFLDAIKAGRKAISLAPDRYEAWSNLGNTLYAIGEVEEARRCYLRAIELKPDFANAFSGLAQLQFREGEFDCAILNYMEVLKRDKSNPQAHYGLALIALTHGEYKRGFELNEWRWRADDSERPMPLPMLPRDDWAISHGKRIMVLAEQGYGDTFMMLRYLNMLLSAGWDVTVNCLSSLHRLILDNWSVKVTDGSKGFAVSDYDCCIHAMSLPLWFGTILETVPWFGPYIKRMRSISSVYGTKRIAYVWHGNPDQGDDRRRSIPELKFKQAFDNALSFSLQVPEDFKSKDWQQTVDTLSGFDLLLTVDTGIAHLAGAMGMPVWVMLSQPCYWPYMMEGDTTPWYPSMKLFRQSQKGDWDSVIAEVKRALDKCVKNGGFYVG